MAITLSPELEAIVVEDAETLGYESAEAYLTFQLTALHDAELYLRENVDEISAMIDEGLESADRGELLSPEQVKESLARHKREWLAKRNAAA